MLKQMDSEDRNGADSQLIDDDDQPLVSQSEDYPSPTVSSENEEDWTTTRGVILNVERLVDDVLKRETQRLVDEHKAKHAQPASKPSKTLNAGPQPQNQVPNLKLSGLNAWNLTAGPQPQNNSDWKSNSGWDNLQSTVGKQPQNQPVTRFKQPAPSKAQQKRNAYVEEDDDDDEWI